MQAEGSLVSRQTVEVKCSNFWNCTFDHKFLKSHEKMAKYLKKYTEPFEVIDNIVQQFPLKEIKSHQNKGWVSILKEVSQKSVRLLTKLGVWPSDQSCHVLPTRIVLICWVFKVTTKNNYWLTFHTMPFLPLTSTYWIIHFAHFLHVNKKYFFGVG